MAEDAHPAQARFALAAVPPHVARLLVIPEGALGCCHDVHGVALQLVVELGAVLADVEDVAGSGRLKLGVLLGPGQSLVPAGTGVVEQEQTAVLGAGAGGQVQVTHLANVVVGRGVGAGGVDSLLPVLVQDDGDVVQDVDATARGGDELRQDGDPATEFDGVQGDGESLLTTIDLLPGDALCDGHPSVFHRLRDGHFGNCRVCRLSDSHDNLLFGFGSLKHLTIMVSHPSIPVNGFIYTTSMSFCKACSLDFLVSEKHCVYR